MEVLFEYRGSRRQLTASSGESVIECVTTELHRIGRSRAQVYTANVDLSTVDRNREVYLLQKWSPQWDCYVDVSRASDISDGDKLAVVIKPKPPSKFLLLCCWCSGVQDQPQVQGVPRNKKNAIGKNEEIQALDYVFNVESVRHSGVSEWADSQSLTPSESKETDLKEGEQYVRAESGRASWKLVPMQTSESSEVIRNTEDDSVVQQDSQQREMEEHSNQQGEMEAVSTESTPEQLDEETLAEDKTEQHPIEGDREDDQTSEDYGGEKSEENGNPEDQRASEGERISVERKIEGGGVEEEGAATDGGEEAEGVRQTEPLTDTDDEQLQQQSIISGDTEVKGDDEPQVAVDSD